MMIGLSKEIYETKGYLSSGELYDVTTAGPDALRSLVRLMTIGDITLYLYSRSL